MTSKIFVSLPVKDLAKSMAFFKAIEWIKRFVTVDAPGRLGAESDCEIRQIVDPDDLRGRSRVTGEV